MYCGDHFQFLVSINKGDNFFRHPTRDFFLLPSNLTNVIFGPYLIVETIFGCYLTKEIAYDHHPMVKIVSSYHP
jgi:hypothetical protein